MTVSSTSTIIYESHQAYNIICSLRNFITYIVVSRRMLEKTKSIYIYFESDFSTVVRGYSPVSVKFQIHYRCTYPLHYFLKLVYIPHELISSFLPLNVYTTMSYSGGAKTRRAILLMARMPLKLISKYPISSVVLFTSFIA